MAKAPRAKQTNPVYDPTRTLQGSSLKKAARTLTNLETRPQISALARQIAQTNRQAQQVGNQTGGYFTQLGDQARQALQAQQGATGRLNATLAGIGQNTQDQIESAGQGAQATLGPLQQRGLDGGSLDRLAQELAAQKSLASQNSQAFQSAGATQGANYEGLTGNQMGVGALRGQERLSELANAFAQATVEPRAKRAELLSSQGALMAKNVGALRDSERNYGLAQATLGLNTQKAAADATTDRARLRQSARQFSVQQARLERQFRLDEQKFGLDVAKNNYQRRNKIGPYSSGGGRRPLTSSQRNAAYDQIDQAKSAVATLQARGLTTAQIRQALTTGSFQAQDENGEPLRISAPRVDGGGYGTFVNAAMDLAIRGRLSPANVKALHRYGLKVRGRYDYQTPTAAKYEW
jgi:hypothetical protein